MDNEMNQHKPTIRKITKAKRHTAPVKANQFINQSSIADDTSLAAAKQIVDRLNKAQLDELYDYIDEALWDRQFETFPEGLIQLEREAMAAHDAGQTQELDLDRF